mmetsp:Transcript_22229/g.34837  ORF Transcript_22229/g.34837 Transcript_22229/m.34837 type:complete len:337 (+) Transcript_22229:62-1072(+)
MPEEPEPAKRPGSEQQSPDKVANSSTGGSSSAHRMHDDDHISWIFRSGMTLFHALFWIPVLGIPGLLCPLLSPFIGFSKAQRWTWRCASIYFRITLWASGISYNVVGLENLNPDSSYFFACNHESIYDIPLAFAGLPFHLIAIAKKAVAYIPILGWAVAAGGTIFIDRGRHQKALDSLDRGRQSLLKRPRSVLLFPEGTRSTTGQIKPFKKGGLVLAIQTGMPVVPVAVCNTRHILGAKVDAFKKVNKCNIMLVIGKPIETDKLSYEDRDKLCEILHEEVVRLKGLWEQGKADTVAHKELQSFMNCWTPLLPYPRQSYGRVMNGFSPFESSQKGRR